MLGISRSNRFKKDAQLCQKQGKDMEKLREIIQILVSEVPIPPKYKDHPLKGKWNGFRDLHIEPDWVLVYYVEDNMVMS